MQEKCAYLHVKEDDVAYVALPEHPGQGTSDIVNKQTSLSALIQEYNGPDIYLDFDKEGRLIGIEILG